MTLSAMTRFPVDASRRRWLQAFLSACACWPAGQALAQPATGRTLRLVTGSPPGALGDVLPRLIGQKITEHSGTAVIIDNRLGAAGAIAAEAVAKAPADGQTLLVAPDTVMVANPFVYPRLVYNPERDFRAVSLIGKASLMLVVSPSLNVRTFAEFVQLVKSRPRAVNYGTGGAGHPTHVIMELVAQRLGLQMTHVPYKGTSPAMQGLLAGEIGAMIVGMAEGLPHLRTGKIIALAGSGPSTREVLPGVAEMKEFHPDLDVSVWFGIFAPVATPQAVVTSVSTEIGRALALPDVRKRMADYGLVVTPMSPAELDQLARSDRARFGPLIKSLGLTAD